MKTLKLFNAVVAKAPAPAPFVSEQGFIIDPRAVWAKDQIIDFYVTEKLNGNDLNKTFHKSWVKIKNSTRLELAIEQIMHYLSTYGSNFQDEIYIPDEVLNVPDTKVSFKVIKAYTVEEMTNKCMDLLQLGIALKEDTLDDLLSLLVDELGYVFTGNDGIRNKEAIVKIADMYGVIPTDTMEFFRYIIYRTTGQSLLIKNKTMIEAITASNFNPAAQFNKFGLDKLSQIFNRFKPLFLAYKTICPKTINKISKLSKKNHKPLVQNPLNMVTSFLLTDNERPWLYNATPFALFKAMSACYSRMNGQDAFVYRIRNGKSWASEGKPTDICAVNYNHLMRHLKKRFDLSGTKVFLPEDIKYALPTSEKMFVGNIPTGTRFYGKKLAVGIYWEDSWGARDLDLSGLNIGGKVGWNAAYRHGTDLMFSGDITSAPNGAVEYLHASRGLKDPTLVQNNVYSGSDDCEYKIIIGKGDKVSSDYMMDPNNLFAEVKCKSVQNNTILGIFIPKNDRQCFVVLNFGAGNARVSGNSEVANLSMKALYQQWRKPINFNKLIQTLGAEVVVKEEDADISYAVDSLDKDSFTKIFKKP